VGYSDWSLPLTSEPPQKRAFMGYQTDKVLEIAAEQGRMLVTHDRKTMPYEFGGYVLERTSPGVVIVPQELPVPQAMYELLLMWSASTAQEWEDMLVQINRPPLSNP
jgi:hypothetical protein